MRHQVRKKRFGRTTSHRMAMFRNMVTSLIIEERITTTVVKAKELRRFAEKMVTLAKTGTLHARRQAAAFVRTNDAVKKLFAELGPRFQERKGGYTRILKLGNRLGDGAPMAIIEYLGYQAKPKKAKAEAGQAAAGETPKAEKKAKAPKKEKNAESKAEKAAKKQAPKAKAEKKPAKKAEKEEKPKKKEK